MRTNPQRAPDTKESIESKRILRVRKILAKHWN